MARFYILLFFVQIVLGAIALISCLSAEESEIRALPRIAWVFVILLFPLLGSIGWFAAGRPVPATPRPGLFSGAFSRRPQPRPLAPDDDPEFLRSITIKRPASETRPADGRETDRRHDEPHRRPESGEPPDERRPEA
ncbi:MAG TPA: PLD nuclease N-terminal domain-containing protein [Micromonospora sp.]|jgi:hypothetical protein